MDAKADEFKPTHEDRPLKIVAPPPNDFELTEAEKRALLLKTLVEIEEQTELKDKHVANIRTLRKRLVSAGHKPALISYALKLRKQEPEEAIEERRAETEMARWLNHPIGTQPELPLVDRTPKADQAFAEGEIAGAQGQVCAPPYAPGNPNEQPWIRGWHDGQKALASGIKKLDAKIAADAADEEEGED